MKPKDFENWKDEIERRLKRGRRSMAQESCLDRIVTALKIGRMAEDQNGLLHKGLVSNANLKLSNFYTLFDSLSVGWFLYIASPQHGDLRLSGPTPGMGADSRARNRDRRVPADLRADS
ncbi:hypothetical protein PoB_001411000 [Plakobranchus ocellatus]|uniref:Uncharacterized protein n=1 Tax=Plakobranchus ocellatus TaxID=259542 RepID=A0AAV3YWM0_9GAST|nr:hypothetical protein PoB_001411000 [Plakobranchus ocellatus]